MKVGAREVLVENGALVCRGPGEVELWRVDEGRAPLASEDGCIGFENGPARRIVDGRLTTEKHAWFVYVLQSQARRRTYVGIAKDPLARLDQHNGLNPGGARSTRGARPWVIARVFGPYSDRSGASKAEHRLKKRRGRARLLDPPP